MNRFPPWLRQQIPGGASLKMTRMLSSRAVHTVCAEALCPNLGNCFKNSQLTFMILGDRCTRACAFCGVSRSDVRQLNIDQAEAEKIREAVRLLGLDFVVITSVCRDDLSDGGAGQFYDVVTGLRNFKPGIKIEVLVPDFNGSRESIVRVLDSQPDVCAHNIETVPRLYDKLRPQADYERSMGVLDTVKRLNASCLTKSSVMAGLGESEEEIVRVMRDLIDCKVDILTLGQYLAPSKNHYPVKEFVSPGQFAKYKAIGLGLGFKIVQSGPLVRSSYQAEGAYRKAFESSHV